MKQTHKTIKKLPDSPGVYFFVGPKRDVLYVGKATSLRSRVRSYFAKNLRKLRGVHIENMVSVSQGVEHRATESVLEALILEAKLIKNFKPKYNTRDKDDKSFNYLVITENEVFPRLLTVRGKDLARTLKQLNTKKHERKRCRVSTYGPFPHASQFKEALKIVRKMFPYYDSKIPVSELRNRSDKRLRFNEMIGLYPSLDITQREYLRTIKKIKMFFNGKKKQLIRSIENDMYKFARQQKFEEADQAKRQIFALKHIQDVSLISGEKTISRSDSTPRVEGYDVSHLAGDDMIGVMSVVQKGEPQKSEYRTFNIRSVKNSNDVKALGEVLSRRLSHTEWEYPYIIVVDGAGAQLNLANRVIKNFSSRIKVVAVTKDSKHKPVSILGPKKEILNNKTDILLANAEAHRFSIKKHRAMRTKRFRAQS